MIFDEVFKIIHQETTQFDEIKDEDGFPCDDLDKISHWIIDQFKIQNSKFKISRVNFSAYGASWVHLDENGKPLTPLYNYLKPFHKELEKQFEAQFGLEKVAQETGSPYSEMLNSGLQLYWLKYAKPEVFKKIKYSLHLPQYLSYLLTGKAVLEFTSIGCHTMLWDYKKNDYHNWVYAEGIDKILPPIVTASHTEIINFGSSQIEVGTGIHDSSASLFPYFNKSLEPFMLLSTGTWCVAMNPFIEFKEKESLKFKEELFYMTIEGKPVKATRLMLGKEYDEGVNKISKKYGVSVEEIQNSKFKIQSLKSLTEGDWSAAIYSMFFNTLAYKSKHKETKSKTSLFEEKDVRSPKSKVQSRRSYSNFRIQNLKFDSLQGDRYIDELLAQLGIEMMFDKEGVSSRIVSKPADNIELDFSKNPDLAQPFACYMVARKLTGKLTGLHTLKHKEADRIKALKTELTKVGAIIKTTDTTLKVIGYTKLKTQNSKLKTHNDHRMAMSLALIQFVHPEFEIENPEVVSKSFPEFWQTLESLGFHYKLTE